MGAPAACSIYPHIAPRELLRVRAHRDLHGEQIERGAIVPDGKHHVAAAERVVADLYGGPVGEVAAVLGLQDHVDLEAVVVGRNWKTREP